MVHHQGLVSGPVWDVMSDPAADITFSSDTPITQTRSEASMQSLVLQESLTRLNREERLAISANCDDGTRPAVEAGVRYNPLWHIGQTTVPYPANHVSAN